MNTYDSGNAINHKCPCCGYEVEWDWNQKDNHFAKGDESFIVIHKGDTLMSDTDKPKDANSIWERHHERAYLLGCPKCGVVSFKIS